VLHPICSSLWDLYVLPLASGIPSIVVCRFATVLLVGSCPFPYIGQIGIVHGGTFGIGVGHLVGVASLHVAKKVD